MPSTLTQIFLKPHIFWHESVLCPHKTSHSTHSPRPLFFDPLSRVFVCLLFLFFFWCDRLAICEILRVFLWTGPKFQTTSPTRHQLQKQGGSWGWVLGLPHPPPPPDDLRLSNTTGIPQNMQICMIYLYSQQFTFSSHYVIAKSKAFVQIAFKICLRHQSVLLFLSGAPPLKKTCIHPLTSVFK